MLEQTERNAIHQTMDLINRRKLQMSLGYKRAALNINPTETSNFDFC